MAAAVHDGRSADILELQEQDVWENEGQGPSLSTGGSNHVSVVMRQPGSDSSSESDYDEQLAKKSKQRSSYHGIEPDSAVSAAVAVSNMASSMQPVPMRRTASVPPDDAASAAKLGTSMPINIPMMPGRSNPLTSEGNENLDVDFVPPHIMEQQKEAKLCAAGQSIVGMSPSTSLKRDRLMHRNAILRRTGFLEGTSIKGSIAEVLDPIKESKESVAIDVRNGGTTRQGMGSPSQSASTSLPREKHSMLSQALGTSISPR